MSDVNDFISQIKINEDWKKSYNDFVPLFIEEAKSKEKWEDWGKNIFNEFFEIGKDQCVSSLSQKYFDKSEQEKIKDCWNELGPKLRKLAQEQDSPNFDLYKDIKTFIRKLTKDDKKAATNRLIASLQPQNLCTIINERMLNELVDLMNKNEIQDAPQIGIDWFHTSNSVITYLKQKTNKNYDEICTLPWQLYELLKSGNNSINNMDMDDTIKDDCVDILITNHNLILTGAPGTGKTYLAKEIAKAMGCSDDEIGFVQFHPSYDYTDFVEGLRPVKDGTIGFERKDGVFKEFCNRALENLHGSQMSIENLKVDDVFNDVYKSLFNEIQDEEICTYETKKHGDLKVYIDNEKIVFEQWNSQRTKSVKKEYLRILFEHKDFREMRSEDILKLERDDLERVIAESNYKANTLDYVQYRWALSKLVEKSKAIKINSSIQQIEKKSFVFIIDEINRGEISKIFGELFFSIDPGYRGTKGKVRTQYANMQTDGSNEFDKALHITDEKSYGHFFIPENVYIIGTMNDIDRSVESMDFAFRRRFAFKEIKASENIGMLDELDLSLKEEAIKRMTNLNNAIWNEAEKKGIEGLSSAYHIGGSYFLKLKNYGNNFDDLWNYHIEGLLREYLRGNPDVDEKIKALKEAYKYE